MLLLLILSFTLPGVKNQGDYIFYYDAHSLAVGGNTTVIENTINPASIGLSGEMLVNFGGLLYAGTEKRGLRVYDSYGNNIGISTIAVNRITEPGFAPASLVIPLAFIRLGARYYQIYDFNYRYYYDYRDDFYQIIKTVDDYYSGSLKSLSPLACFNYKGFSFGVEQRFVYGDIKSEQKIIFPQDEDSIVNRSYKFSGSSARAGVLFVPSDHYGFGYCYTHRLNVADANNTMVFPASHVLGCFYRPPQRVPTKFMVEIDYQLWDEPILIYKFGVEHTILYHYVLRYGFCLFPDHAQTAIWTTNITFGFGIKLKNYHFDAGFAYGKRDYKNSDFGGLEIGETYIFDETHNHFLISIGFKF